VRDVVVGNVSTQSYWLFVKANSRTARSLLRRESDRDLVSDCKDCCERITVQAEGIDGTKIEMNP